MHASIRLPYNMVQETDAEWSQHFRALMARSAEEIEEAQLIAFYEALWRVTSALPPGDDALSDANGDDPPTLFAAWFCSGLPAYMAVVHALVRHMRPAFAWDDHVRLMRSVAFF